MDRYRPISRKLKDFLEKGPAVFPSGDTQGFSPRISIIMPSYNQATFLERSIRSVLNQEYPNLEFIIIDGGSTDGSVEMIKKYESRLAYWVSESDGGQTDALNKGLARATGDWVGWQNADDVYFPGAFAAVLAVAKNVDAGAMISGVVSSIDAQDNVVGLGKYTTPTFHRLLYEGFIMGSQGVFWNRNLCGDLGVFNTDLNHAMDYDFWLGSCGCIKPNSYRKLSADIAYTPGQKPQRWVIRGRMSVTR